MSGLNALVEPCTAVRRHRQIAGTPTQLTNTKQLAVQAPVAGVMTLGYGNSVVSRSPYPGSRSGSSAAKSGSPGTHAARPGPKDAVHRLNGGGLPGGNLRYSRARPAMGRVEHSSRAFTVP